MKKLSLNIVKHIFGDRPVILMSSAIILVGLIYILYVAFSLSPTELQVATHFTAFGETQFYRNKWYYLLTFIALAIIIIIGHIAIVAKLKERGMRPLALAFGWLTLIALGLLFAITHSVFGIAYLS